MRRRRLKYVRVPIDMMDDIRVIIGAAAALTASPPPDDPHLWLERLGWAVDQLPLLEREYYYDYALRMPVQS